MPFRAHHTGQVGGLHIARVVQCGGIRLARRFSCLSFTSELDIPSQRMRPPSRFTRMDSNRTPGSKKEQATAEGCPMWRYSLGAKILLLVVYKRAWHSFAENATSFAFHANGFESNTRIKKRTGNRWGLSNVEVFARREDSLACRLQASLTLLRRECDLLRVSHEWIRIEHPDQKKNRQPLRVVCSFFGRSVEIRTPGLQFPNKYAIVFWLLLLTFWCFLVRKRCFPMLL